VDADQLRAVQKPPKDRYWADPSTAPVTLSAEGDLGSQDVSCSVRTGQVLVEAGLRPTSGGDGSFACSGDMLL
jgi:hypothetical protein